MSKGSYRRQIGKRASGWADWFQSGDRITRLYVRILGKHNLQNASRILESYHPSFGWNIRHEVRSGPIYLL